MNLPEKFVERMRSLLAHEWSDFEAALQQPATRGVRFHRISMLDKAADLGTGLLALQHRPLSVPRQLEDLLHDPIPWFPDGFYVSPQSELGRHVYHEMGLYYLQEPSAMAAVSALDPKPGERVLDLCAAPGGKTTGISGRMRGHGLLVANEIHPTRVVTLAQNLERLGVDAVVTNESPNKLAETWQASFDAVLVDAPCSGEGMFRKDPDATLEWKPDLPEICTRRQEEILAAAISMVKPGGRIVYSTCTFNPLENERLVEWVLQNYDVAIEALPVWEGWSKARTDWTLRGTNVDGARRLWPHRGRGEGHFVCRFIRLDSSKPNGTEPSPGPSRTPIARKTGKGTHVRGEVAVPKDWAALLTSIVGFPPDDWLFPVMQGTTVFSRPTHDIPLQGLRVLRPGLCLGTLNHKRWEPHHHLAMSLATDAACHRMELDLQSAARYLSGETLPSSGQAGWMWMHSDGFPVGWGKAVQGRINNAYPKGLRKMGLLSQHLPSISGLTRID